MTRAPPIVVVAPDRRGGAGPRKPVQVGSRLRIHSFLPSSSSTSLGGFCYGASYHIRKCGLQHLQATSTAVFIHQAMGFNATANSSAGLFSRGSCPWATSPSGCSCSGGDSSMRPHGEHRRRVGGEAGQRKGERRGKGTEEGQGD